MTVAPPEPPVQILTDYERLLRLEDALEQLATQIEEIRSQQEKLQRALEETQDMLLLEIAQDRKRITKLECGDSISKQTAERHLDVLCKEMDSAHLRQVSFGQAAKILGISYRHVYRLSPAIEDDPRFQLVKDQTHMQRWLIRRKM